MEALSYVVEETESTIMARFCEKLAEVGFEDFHNSAIARASDSLKELLGIDIVKEKSFAKVFSKPSRPHLLINTTKSSIITLSDSVEKGCIEGKAFEVTCFSKSRKEAIDLAETTKSLLTKELGFASTIIHDGSFDENCNKALIKTIPETPRSNLVKNVGKDILNVFTNMENKDELRRLSIMPFKAYHGRMLGRLNPDDLVSSAVMKECFAPICKKCGGGLQIPFLFDSRRELSKVLKSKSLVCPNCKDRLNSENVTIDSFYMFTDLGHECAKGLWLEAYVKSVLEELGICDERIRICSVHGRDEIDIIFSEGDSLFVCECKDKNVGQNDLYVLAMKVSRINEEKNTPAHVDKVLMVSSNPIPKEILATSQEKIKYFSATGNPEKIKKELVKTVNRARQEYKSKRLKKMEDLLLMFLPSRLEEAYIRWITEEEYE
jgi:hypothetical protein